MISEWQLELPANPSKNDPAQFDYDMISDVILNIRYTARKGGGLLRKGAVDHLKTLIDDGKAAGSVRLCSVRHKFPTEWAKFQGQTPGDNQRFELTLNLCTEHYPFWSQARLNGVAPMDILARSLQAPVPGNMDIFENADMNDGTKKDTLTKDAAPGNLLVGKLTNIALPIRPVGEFKLFFNDRALDDLWTVVTWGRE